MIKPFDALYADLEIALKLTEQQEEYRVQRYQGAGLNDNGTKPPLMKLAENKTFKNLAGNVVLPFLEGMVKDFSGFPACFAEQRLKRPRVLPLRPGSLRKPPYHTTR